jgi:hypothetical protein
VKVQWVAHTLQYSARWRHSAGHVHGYPKSLEPYFIFRLLVPFEEINISAKCYVQRRVEFIFRLGFVEHHVLNICSGFERFIGTEGKRSGGVIQPKRNSLELYKRGVSFRSFILVFRSEKVGQHRSTYYSRTNTQSQKFFRALPRIQQSRDAVMGKDVGRHFAKNMLCG